ncbi:hypothetical protein [Rheinheimera maricola]|uniref:DUF3618 domain-containing protein n=1 Tax=Rheinheimera maricola TaxID=2793282 RepID=A0ABS7XDY5_9GAMM|nr:hypothetical protein [Rheinheimera maricola]MBZ9613334.1 hypothetical protein [Rheinheimera maricola]
MQHDQQIAKLVAQLPRQRQQLAGQTSAVTQAVYRGLSSPASLSVAVVAGAMLSWRWFKPTPSPEQHNKHCDESAIANSKLSAAPIGNLLRQSLSGAFMAYLVRNLA